MDSVPKVTRNPDYPDVFIFSDGGNTRYQILCELWQETGDEGFIAFIPSSNLGRGGLRVSLVIWLRTKFVVILAI
jgi:hypothetical protein